MGVLCPREEHPHRSTLPPGGASPQEHSTLGKSIPTRGPSPSEEHPHRETCPHREGRGITAGCFSHLSTALTSTWPVLQHCVFRILTSLGQDSLQA